MTMLHERLHPVCGRSVHIFLGYGQASSFFSFHLLAAQFHVHASLHKARSTKKKASLYRCRGTRQSRDFNAIRHLWDTLERRLRARSYHPPSAPDLTNTLVVKYEQIPVAGFQNCMSIFIYSDTQYGYH